MSKNKLIVINTKRLLIAQLGVFAGLLSTLISHEIISEFNRKKVIMTYMEIPGTSWGFHCLVFVSVVSEKLQGFSQNRR